MSGRWSFGAILAAGIVASLSSAASAAAIFWTEIDDSSNGVIKRSDENGAAVETVLADETANFIFGLTVDYTTGKIYWGTSDGRIRSANLDGTGISTVADTGANFVWNMAVHDGEIFFNSSGGPGARGVGRINVDGTGLTFIGPEVDGEGLAYDAGSDLVFFQGFSGVDIGSIAGNGGGGLTSLDLTVGFVPGIAVDEINDLLYYAETNGSLFRSDYNGENRTLITTLPTSDGAIYSLAIDASRDRIFYGTRGSAGIIGRIDLDGSNPTTLVSNISTLYAITFVPDQVPEPGVLMILCLGLAGVGIVRWRRD